jgi:RNA-splicing ligase RtcB
MSDVTGKDLIKMGFSPSPWFGEALREIGERRLSLSQAAPVAQRYVDDVAKSEAERRARERPLHATAPDWRLNITAESEAEQANLDAVMRSFELLVRTPTVETGAVMPDACPAGPEGTIPVGGVIAARDAIHPGMHSADICCSLFATVFEKASPTEVMEAIFAATHFGPGGRPRHAEMPLPPELRERLDADPMLSNGKIRAKIRSDMGTQGDGNHFSYVGRSEATGKTVLVTHHGSRGPGAMLYKAGIEIAERFRQEISPETLPQNAWIPARSEEGVAYWAALQLIREWTKASHQALHDVALTAVRDTVMDRFWNEHNFVFREEDGGDGDLFWHAKGATPIHTPLLPDVTGPQILPLNMAQPILLIEGTRNARNLGFAPHGAGRNLSRTAHKRVKEHLTPEQAFAQETAGIDARFFCGKIDVSELPSAYKDADRVRADMARFGLANVVDEIRPYGAIMAGDWEMDAPWRRKKGVS